MKKAMLLDTSIGTSNVGDDIIMECVEKELAPILANMFVFHLPTHVPAFHSYAIWRNSFAVQNYATCDYRRQQYIGKEYADALSAVECEYFQLQAAGKLGLCRSGCRQRGTYRCLYDASIPQDTKSFVIP